MAHARTRAYAPTCARRMPTSHCQLLSIHRAPLGANEQQASDGSFFMTMGDFCNKFDGVTACVVTSDEMPYFTLIEGSWEKGCCGGVSSLNSPQYYLTAPIGTQVSVQLTVPEKALKVRSSFLLFARLFSCCSSILFVCSILLFGDQVSTSA